MDQKMWWWLCRGVVFAAVVLTAVGCGGGDEASAEAAGEDAVVSGGGSDTPATTDTPKQDVGQALAISYDGPPAVKTIDEAAEVVEALRKKYDTTNVPDVLTPPYDREGVLEYAKAMKAFQVARPIDLAWLEKLDGKSLEGADGYNNQRVDNAARSLRSRLADYFPGEFEHSLKYTRVNLRGNVDSTLQTLRIGAEADPSNDGDLRNKLAREDRVQMYRQAGRTAYDLAVLGAALDRVVEEDGTDWADKGRQATELLATLEQKAQAAAKLIVPPVDLGDKKLRVIAEEVLSRERYGLPPRVRLIVNAPIRKYDRTLYTLDTHSIHRGQSVWQEFQVTTIERAEDGRHYLFYHDLVKYEKAASQTPTGKWLLGDRFRGSPIVEENFEK